MGAFNFFTDGERSSVSVRGYALSFTILILPLLFLFAVPTISAPCTGCADYGPARTLSTDTTLVLSDASGLAASAKNPGVIWTHNDSGADNPLVYAIRTNGAFVAAFDITADTLADLEDIAIGPGPVAGVSYLYVGDIGVGALGTSNRASVRIFRAPEPQIPPNLSPDGPILSLSPVERFTLVYPDGSYDADTMMVDPLTGDVLIGAKQPGATRIYRASLAGAADGAAIPLQLVATTTLGSASGGTISADGTRIVLRNERNARLWFRCPGESIGAALARSARPIPLVGTLHETNGEAISFLPDGSGYVTVSDSVLGPPLFFLPLNCATNGAPPITNAPPPAPAPTPTIPATRIVTQPQGAVVEPGSHVQLAVMAAGQNLRYQWRLNGVPLTGAVTDTLLLTDLQPTQSGNYSVLVLGDNGSALSESAAVVVRSSAPEPMILIPPESIYIVRGGSGKLTVYASGEEPLSYTWTRNGRVLASTGPELLLHKVKISSAGFYRVSVANVHGAAEAEAEVQVVRGPTVRVSANKKVARVGSTVVLRAVAHGPEPLEYHWLFNDQPIVGENGSTLVLAGVDETDSGLYVVRVMTPVGFASDGVKVRVR